MKYWDDFLEEVMPYVENCPVPIAKNHIRNAAIEFCQRTALWRHEVDRINITADIHTYELNDELDTDQAISAIDYALLAETDSNTPLGVTSELSLKNNDPTWQMKTAAKPGSIMLLDTENCRLYPTPEQDITNSLIVNLILKPSRDAAGIPDWIYEQHMEAISHGAKARLYGMKGRPWYDPNEGVDEQVDFDNAIKDTTIRTNKGNSTQNLRVKMRPIA